MLHVDESSTRWRPINPHHCLVDCLKRTKNMASFTRFEFLREYVSIQKIRFNNPSYNPAVTNWVRFMHHDQTYVRPLKLRWRDSWSNSEVLVYKLPFDGISTTCVPPFEWDSEEFGMHDVRFSVLQQFLETQADQVLRNELLQEQKSWGRMSSNTYISAHILTVIKFAWLNSICVVNQLTITSCNISEWLCMKKQRVCNSPVGEACTALCCCQDDYVWLGQSWQ